MTRRQAIALASASTIGSTPSAAAAAAAEISIDPEDCRHYADFVAHCSDGFDPFEHPQAMSILTDALVLAPLLLEAGQPAEFLPTLGQELAAAMRVMRSRLRSFRRPF